jgi:hypothetical protein
MFGAFYLTRLESCGGMRGKSWLGIEEDVVPVQRREEEEGPPVTNTSITRPGVSMRGLRVLERTSFSHSLLRTG